ncbi:MAG: hypothetical protein KJP04_10560 [Arenicella sp.]|nr:hypothetical protein [Arenicella sp.]
MGLVDLQGLRRMTAMLVAVPLFIAHGGVWADDSKRKIVTDTHEHNVEHMLELMGVPEQVDRAAGDVLKLYSAKVEAGNGDPIVQKLVDAYQQDATRLVYGTLGWANMKTTYIFSYANRMSEEDVVEVVSFLQSVGGQKFITSQADAGLEIQQTTQHLVEVDMAEPLAELGKKLRDGLAKVQAAQRGKK